MPVPITIGARVMVYDAGFPGWPAGFAGCRETIDTRPASRIPGTVIRIEDATATIRCDDDTEHTIAVPPGGTFPTRAEKEAQDTAAEAENAWKRAAIAQDIRAMAEAFTGPVVPPEVGDRARIGIPGVDGAADTYVEATVTAVNGQSLSLKGDNGIAYELPIPDDLGYVGEEIAPPAPSDLVPGHSATIDVDRVDVTVRVGA